MTDSDSTANVTWRRAAIAMIGLISTLSAAFCGFAFNKMDYILTAQANMSERLAIVEAESKKGGRFTEADGQAIVNAQTQTNERHERQLESLHALNQQMVVSNTRLSTAMEYLSRDIAEIKAALDDIGDNE